MRWPRQGSSNWHDRAFLGLHYDLHARARDPGLGGKLTLEHLVAELAKVGADWVQCDAKGHPGYASYPTRVGSVAPDLTQDLLGLWREATRRLGVPLAVHYSGVWDTRAIELHPEWGGVDRDGKRDPHSTCRLSGYEAELMIPQLLELVTTYQVDGFWVDGDNWAAKPCWCERCAAEYARRVGAVPPLRATDAGWDDWLAFHRDLFGDYVARYAAAVHEHNPDCLVCSSWLYSLRQPDALATPVDYLSGDYDYAWGSARAASEGRMLDGRGLSWDLMAWGFVKPGLMAPEEPGLPYARKPALHLMQEAAEVVALGGAIMLYDQPRRDGRLVGWQQDRLAEVARFCRERQAVCLGTESASEAAVLNTPAHLYHHNDPLYNNGDAAQPVEGALHALLESGLSADLLTPDRLVRAERYRLLVVPEQTRLSPDLVATLETLARQGVCLVMSGAHLSREHPDLVGAAPLGAARGVASPSGDPFWAALFLPDEAGSVPVSGPWQAVSPATGTAVWQRRWDGPEPGDETGEAIVTARKVGRGRVVAVHAPVFADYWRGHYPGLRRWIAALVADLELPWRVELNGPPWLERVDRRRGGSDVINLINRGAFEALHPTRNQVEAVPPVTAIDLRVRCAQPPRSVRLLPSGLDCPWSHGGGVLKVHVPRVDIHEALVIEHGSAPRPEPSSRSTPLREVR